MAGAVSITNIVIKIMIMVMTIITTVQVDTSITMATMAVG